MSVKISELPSLETLADNDILAGVDTSEDTTSKITLEQVKDYATEDTYSKSETDEQIEKLQEELDAVSTIYNAFPTVSDEDESMTLNGTAESKFKTLDLKGNTSQETTKSINLAYNITQYGKRCDFNIEEGKNYTLAVMLSVSASNTNQYYTGAIPQIDGENAFSRTYKSYPSTTSVGTIMWYNLTGLKTGKINMETFGQSLGNPYYENVMIVEGTYDLSTLPTYEPYTGGSPAPNPSYPRDVNVVSGDNTIYVEGKNLFDGVFRQGNRYTNGLNDTTRLFTTQNYFIKQGQRYTLSTTLGSNYKYAINLSAIKFPLTAGTSYFYDSGWKTGTFTFVPSQDGYLGIVVATTNGTDNLTPSNISSFTWQLEKGSPATTYEPYKRNTYPINLGSIELCKIGDYQDYLYKENGSWYLHKEIGKVVLDGSENWSKSSKTTVNRYNTSGGVIATILNANSVDIISNYFTCITPAQSDANSIGLSKLNANNLMVNFDLSDTNFDTLAKFKTWLGNNNTIVYYVLATPTNTEITDNTLISQLDNLKNANSYDTQTNISQENNDKPFIINAEAILSLKNILEGSE